MKKFIVLAVSAFVLAGCANTRFNVTGEITPSSQPKYEERQNYFISGLGQMKTVDATRICGGAEKVSAVAKEMTFIDGLISFVTFGIWTPETTRVYCK